MSTLSRHFYCLEDVAASLAYSCSRGRIGEAAFWLQELIDSGEAALAITTLVETCIYHCGIHGFTWLHAAHTAFTEPTEEGLYGATMSLCRIRSRDYSFIGLHILGDAAATGPGNLFLTDINEWAGTEFADKSIAILCYMAQAATDQPLNTQIPPSVQEARARWAAAFGRRHRRELAIDSQGVRIVTRRGRMQHTQSNERELMAIGLQWKTVGFMTGCTTWDEMMEWHGIANGSDDAWELFCEMAFPDDIPDEWSAADRALSHGSGLAGHPTVSAKRWLMYNLPPTEMGGIAFEGSHFLVGREKTIRRLLEADANINRQIPVTEFWTVASWLATYDDFATTFASKMTL
jgi:hypothetical protein